MVRVDGDTRIGNVSVSEARYSHVLHESGSSSISLDIGNGPGVANLVEDNGRYIRNTSVQ